MKRPLLRTEPYAMEDSQGHRIVMRAGGPRECAGLTWSGDGHVPCGNEPVAVVGRMEPIPDVYVCRRHLEAQLVFVNPRNVVLLRKTRRPRRNA